MNELILMIQSDPELWDLIERLKNQDEELDEFIIGIAQMFAIEFKELDRSDLDEKLDSLFGGLPAKAKMLAPQFLHIALDMYMQTKVSNSNGTTHRG